MYEIIEESNDGKKSTYHCKVCPTRPKLDSRSVYRHILHCETHQNLVTSKEHEKLIELIRSKMKNNKELKQGKKSDVDTKSYLEFLGFCMKENYSFLQISSLGKYLKSLVERKSISFFEKHSFDDEELSKVANCFGTSLLDQLKEDLSASPFSLAVDNVTLGGKNICGLQVRYLKQYAGESDILNIKLENRIIGIKNLEESSTGDALLKVVKEKLLDMAPQIKDNFRGIVHDHGSNLSGKHKGLSVLLENELENYFMDLEDPCHSLNLTLVKSLQALPNNFTEFFRNIQNHFAWPQRVAFLKKIQEENNLKRLNPLHYVENRWLSLGTCLRRIIEIWESLVLYMRAKPKFTGVLSSTYEYFTELLENKVFRLKIICLANLIEKINIMNIKFQNQHMEIQNLKQEINKCLFGILDLYIIPEAIPSNLFNLYELGWIDSEVQKKHFIKHEEFISKLITEVDNSLGELKELTLEERKDFADIFQSFLAGMLSYLIYYLPLNSTTVDSLDFVTLNHKPHILKEKILYFNKVFGIIPSDQIKDLL